jgi:hypothetical protein
MLLLPERGLVQKRAALFGREDRMHQDLGQGLRHDGENAPAVTLLQLLQS